jgi:ubiquinone/menaquinone biosynthesis C-methylase UbiE
MQEAPLTDLWEAQALAWTLAARASGEQRDRLFWDLNLPALLELLPEPGRLAVDVGCGEGRLTRVLRERGYRVVAVDRSPTLIRLAHEEDPSGDYRLGTPDDLPLEDGEADLAVASMTYQDLEQVEPALQEARRVLGPGGVLVASILHPAMSGDARSHYFSRGRFSTPSKRYPELVMPGTHRTVSDYVMALLDAGFVLEALSEPEPNGELIRDPTRPMFMVLRGRLP